MRRFTPHPFPPPRGGGRGGAFSPREAALPMMLSFLPHLPSTQALFAQLTLGLINGAFYAMLSLGLAVIFGLLNIINFTHGAQYMLGAFCTWLMLDYLGIGYWPALILAPIVVGLFGMALERLLLRHIY